MHTLAQAIFNDKNLHLLPDCVEGGTLPALVLGPGKTSRANLAAALRLMVEVEHALIVTIICDRGDRYLSTGLFS